MDRYTNINKLIQSIDADENRQLKVDVEAIKLAYHESNDHQSLPIKILSILGGIIASLCLLGFLFLVGIYDSSFGSLLLGGIGIGSAILISRGHDRIIVDTTTVSLYIIGIILLVVGLVINQLSFDNIAVIVIAVAVFSLVFIKNYVLTFIAVLIIHASIIVYIHSCRAHDLIHVYLALLTFFMTYLFIDEAEIVAKNKPLLRLYSPVKIGVVCSFLSVFIIIQSGHLPLIDANYIWVSSIFTIISIVYLLSTIFVLLKIDNRTYQVYIYCISVLILIPTALSPAISGTILLMLLSLMSNYKTSFALSIIGFIYFLSRYYYDLNYTLLTKSLLLLGSGILFLLLYLLIQKKLTSNEKI